MLMPVFEDVGTLEELQENPDGVVNRVRRTGRPLVLKKKSKPHVVMMDFATYEKKLRVVNLGRLLAEAEAELRAGKGRPVEDFFAELDREKNTPRNHRTKRRA